MLLPCSLLGEVNLPMHAMLQTSATVAPLDLGGCKAPRRRPKSAKKPQGYTGKFTEANRSEQHAAPRDFGVRETPET
eukprot:514862-Amphidinium_carterae.1